MRSPTPCAGWTRIPTSAPWSRRWSTADGTTEYLCKRYPAVIDLALRGFAPRFVRALFRRRLDRYEMRDRIERRERASRCSTFR